VARCDQKTTGIDVQSLGNAFDCLKGQVAFATFKAPEVGPVPGQDFSEGFLGETPASPGVASDSLQQSPASRPESSSYTVTKCYLTVYRLITSVNSNPQFRGQHGDNQKAEGGRW
jgi:hypothetical protein